jgi:hypothetical protein
VQPRDDVVHLFDHKEISHPVSHRAATIAANPQILFVHFPAQSQIHLHAEKIVGGA